MDLAVGTGPNIQFYPTGPNVTLTDLSPRMLEVAKSKFNRQGLEACQCPLERLPFAENTFDTVLSIDVFCSCQVGEA